MMRHDNSYKRGKKLSIKDENNDSSFIMYYIMDISEELVALADTKEKAIMGIGYLYNKQDIISKHKGGCHGKK